MLRYRAVSKAVKAKLPASNLPRLCRATLLPTLQQKLHRPFILQRTFATANPFEDSDETPVVELTELEVKAELDKLGLDVDDWQNFPLEDSNLEQELDENDGQDNDLIEEETTQAETGPAKAPEEDEPRVWGPEWADGQLKLSPHLWNIKLEIDREMEQGQDEIFYGMTDTEAAISDSLGLFSHIPMLTDAAEFTVEFQDLEADYMIAQQQGDYENMQETDQELDDLLFNKPEDVLDRIEIPLEDRNGQPLYDDVGRPLSEVWSPEIVRMLRKEFESGRAEEPLPYQVITVPEGKTLAGVVTERRPLADVAKEQQLDISTLLAEEKAYSASAGTPDEPPTLDTTTSILEIFTNPKNGPLEVAGFVEQRFDDVDPDVLPLKELLDESQYSDIPTHEDIDGGHYLQQTCPRGWRPTKAGRKNYRWPILPRLAA